MRRPWGAGGGCRHDRAWPSVGGRFRWRDALRRVLLLPPALRREFCQICDAGTFGNGCVFRRLDAAKPDVQT